MESKNIYILLILLTVGCFTKHDESVIIGSWRTCMRDGRYAEIKITANRMVVYWAEDFPNAGIYKHKIINDSSVIFGLNDNTLKHEIGSKIEILAIDSIKLSYYGNEMVLVRLEKPIEELLDTTKLEEWQQGYGKDFQTRYSSINCLDMRTEKEKNPELKDLGEVEDDFEEIEFK